MVRMCGSGAITLHPLPGACASSRSTTPCSCSTTTRLPAPLPPSVSGLAAMSMRSLRRCLSADIMRAASVPGGGCPTALPRPASLWWAARAEASAACITRRSFKPVSLGPAGSLVLGFSLLSTTVPSLVAAGSGFAAPCPSSAFLLLAWAAARRLNSPVTARACASPGTGRPRLGMAAMGLAGTLLNADDTRSLQQARDASACAASTAHK
mmetsp:Transcript_950/g.2543  ORF Transcript_950/g.2543 Transcript_950/m.2543 type:complete len:210 (-) Transcript_950:432-1061(-)